jgi:hypothetical protein
VPSFAEEVQLDERPSIERKGPEMLGYLAISTFHVVFESFVIRLSAIPGEQVLVREDGTRERSPVRPVLHERVEDITIIMVAKSAVAEEVLFGQAVGSRVLGLRSDPPREAVMVAVPTHKARQVERWIHAVMLALRFVGKEAAEYPAVDDGFAKLLTMVEDGVPSCIESVIYVSEYKARNVGDTHLKPPRD